MQVRDCMTPEVRTVGPDQSIQDAARMMAALDVGMLPVGEGDRLVGMITDRDIAIRAVADGMDASSPVREAMTSEVRYCFDDEEVEHVVRNMGDLQVRRLPVMDRRKRLVGIVALCDIARHSDDREPVGETLNSISRPGRHSQGNQEGLRQAL